MDKENEIVDEVDEKEKKKLTKSKLELQKKKEGKRTNEIESLNFLVHQYFIRNDFDSCFEVLSKYSKNKSGFESPYSIIIKGLIARSGGRLSESLSLFKDCHAIYRYSNDTSYILKEIGKTFYLLGKMSDSADIYNNVLHKNKDDWDCYYHIGLIFLNKKKYEKAEEYINMALNLNPCKEVLIASGKIYLKKGNKDQAIQRFEDALKLSPDDNNLMSTLGSLYLKAKDYEKAVDYFNKVLEVDKKYSKSLLGLAAINQLNGKFEEAYELLSMGFSSNNNSAYLWNNLGMWFFAKEKKIFAATCLKRALYLAPFEWFISFNLGLVYLKNEQYVTAFVHMNTAANLSKNQPNVYLYLAIICSELNNDGNAKNCFERALSLKEDPIILFNYIIFLLKKKMFKEAKEKFDKLKDINSKLKKKNEEIDAQIPVINKILGTG
jgi:Bardet-Biedl syndrome 4 protein